MLVSAPTGGKRAQQDSGHWYTTAGAPAYEQRTGNGGVRPTDLRDARKYGLVPSVTTVLSVLAKPALTTWLVDQGIMAALTLPRIDGESERAFLDRVRADSKAQAIAAAEEGTRIHDALESALKRESFPEKYQPHVAAVERELQRLFPEVRDWVAEASFAHPLGFGGKVDLHSPSTGIVCDYKGKDGDFSDGKKLAFDQHYQLAAYNRGLGLRPNVCANLFVSRTHAGCVASHVWSQADVDHGWAVFDSCLEVWKHLKKFDPAFIASEAA